jgi:Bacteriophage HK97-gp10, putative tail-component
MASLTFTGGRELDQILRNLGTKGALRIGRQALRRSGNDFLRDVRAAAPVDDGRLRKALRLRVDRGKYNKSLLSALIYASASASKYRPRKTQRRSRIKGKLGPARYSYQIGSRPDVYGIFQEFGAPAHGLPARPWFRPAWDRKKNDLVQALLQELASGIARAAVESMGE